MGKQSFDLLFRSTMMQLLVLLLVAPSVLVSALVHPRQQMELLGYPVYHNGPWPFIACTESQGQALVDLFKKSGEILSNTIIPALSSIPPDPHQDPFITFFSTNSRAAVQNVFQKFVDRPKYVKYGIEHYPPHIICLNNDHTPPPIQKAKDECDARSTALGFVHPVVPSDGADIFLCPSFFTTIKPFPEAGVNCPTVVYRLSSTQFHRHSDALDNQFGVLMHELTHIYHPDETYDSLEIYDLNAIIDTYPQFHMTAGHQLNNANNYAYYAVCVYLGCQTYPLSRAIDGKRKRQSTIGFNTTGPIPNVLEDVTFAPDSLDADQLQANLTALGY